MSLLKYLEHRLPCWESSSTWASSGGGRWFFGSHKHEYTHTHTHTHSCSHTHQQVLLCWYLAVDTGTDSSSLFCSVIQIEKKREKHFLFAPCFYFKHNRMKGRYKKRDLRDRCKVPDKLCSFPGDPAAGFAEPNVPTPVFTSQEGSGSKRGRKWFYGDKRSLSLSLCWCRWLSNGVG